MTRIPSGMLRKVAARQADDEELAEFVVLLVTVLEIPEVRDRVAGLLQIQQRPTPSSPPAAGRAKRR